MNTPIIFISGVYHDAATFRILKESLHVDFVLEKPIQPGSIERFLRQLCLIDQNLSVDRSFSDYFLAEAWANYQKTIFDKIERLERMIQLVQKNPDQKNFQNLRTEIHKLAGSSGSYGYSKVSSLCKSLEQDLINRIEQLNENIPDAAWVNSLDNFFTELKLNFQISSFEEDAPEPFPGPPIDTYYSLYIIEDDASLLSNAIKRGLSYVLVKPLSEAILSFLLQKSIAGYRILIVDDDSDSIQYITQSLKYFGFEVNALSDALLLQETLMNYHPDILMVDVDLSDEKKADVFHLLQRVQYKNLLVAMVTIPQESNLIKMIYGSEVDDVLFKPLESSIIQMCILNLLKKVNKKGIATIDPSATGLWNLQAFHTYVNSIVLKSSNESFEILVIFEIVHDQTRIEQIGQSAFETIVEEISQAINQAMKIEKHACYLGKGRFALFFSGYDLHYLRLLMQTFLEELREQFTGKIPLAFHCGISTVRKGGQFLEQFLEQFEQLFRKKSEKYVEMVNVVILDPIDMRKKQSKAYIFESNYTEINQLVQIFQEEAIEVFLNEQLEKIVTGLTSKAGAIFVLAGIVADRQEDIRKIFLEKNIKLPTVYMPILSKETLTSFFREGLNYNDNPFNILLILDQ